MAMALFTVREMELLAAYHKNGLALFIFSLLNKKEEPTTQNTGAMRATFTHALALDNNAEENAVVEESGVHEQRGNIVLFTD